MSRIGCVFFWDGVFGMIVFVGVGLMMGVVIIGCIEGFGGILVWLYFYILI